MSTAAVNPQVEERARNFSRPVFHEVPCGADPARVRAAFYSWSSMLERCFMEASPSYARYGGRGITVCPRWLVFADFLDDMGPRPVDLSLGRIDNDGHYEPVNCRWETPLEQGRNTRRNVRIRGVLQVDVARATGMAQATLSKRRARCIPIERLLDPTPLPTSKLNKVAAHEIRAALAAGESRMAVAQRYNVTRQAIGAIARGQTWRDE